MSTTIPLTLPSAKLQQTRPSDETDATRRFQKSRSFSRYASSDTLPHSCSNIQPGAKIAALTPNCANVARSSTVCQPPPLRVPRPHTSMPKKRSRFLDDEGGKNVPCSRELEGSADFRGSPPVVDEESVDTAEIGGIFAGKFVLVV